MLSGLVGLGVKLPPYTLKACRPREGLMLSLCEARLSVPMAIFNGKKAEIHKAQTLVRQE